MIPLYQKIRSRLWPHRQRWAFLLLLFSFLWISITSVQEQSITYDEPEHYRYGMQILQGNPERFDDSKMPFSALNAFPAWIAANLHQGPLRVFLESFTTARFVTVLISLGFACLVYLWSRRLYGSAAALLSLFLYTWDPNIIAHSQLVTTDVYALGTIALSMYCLWRFSQQRDWKRLLAFALALGVSQLAKYTAVFLYPLAVLLLLVRDSPDLVRWLFSRQWGHLGRYAIHSLVWTGVTLALSLVIINAGFLFHRSLMQLGEIHFKSEFFLSAQSRLVIFKDVRLPVPQPFLRGLDLVRYRERSGRGYAKIYLFGQFRKEGFPGYYLIASLFKVPIAELLLSLVASIVYFWKRSFHRFLENELFLWGPVLFFTLYFNFFYRAQIGIRFFLVVFPFIQIFSGSLLKDWASIRPRLKWAIGILAVYMLLSVLSYYPNFIPYFNELVIDRRFAYRVLADSNLDWGQGSKAVSEYQNVHPGALINPDSPVAGTVVVSANNLVGITAEPLTYRWLRENFRPVTTVAYSHLVYQISEQDLLRLGIVPP